MPPGSVQEPRLTSVNACPHVPPLTRPEASQLAGASTAGERRGAGIHHSEGSQGEEADTSGTAA